ncbi:unnamed protein product, partial [Phaeothamnion confervicola]
LQSAGSCQRPALVGGVDSFATEGFSVSHPRRPSPSFLPMQSQVLGFRHNATGFQYCGQQQQLQQQQPPRQMFSEWPRDVPPPIEQPTLLVNRGPQETAAAVVPSIRAAVNAAIRGGSAQRGATVVIGSTLYTVDDWTDPPEQRNDFGGGAAGDLLPQRRSREGGGNDYYHAMRVSELRQLCRDRGITIGNRGTKSGLIGLIEENDAASIDAGAVREGIITGGRSGGGSASTGGSSIDGVRRSGDEGMGGQGSGGRRGGRGRADGRRHGQRGAAVSGGGRGPRAPSPAAPRQTLNCRLRLLSILMGEDHRDAFLRHELRATREELDAGAVGARSDFWRQIGASFRNAATNVGGNPGDRMLYDSVDLGSFGEHSDEKLREMWATLRRNYNAMLNRNRTSGNHANMADFARGPTGSRNDEVANLWFYDWVTIRGDNDAMASFVATCMSDGVDLGEGDGQVHVGPWGGRHRRSGSSSGALSAGCGGGSGSSVADMLREAGDVEVDRWTGEVNPEQARGRNQRAGSRGG